MTGPNETRVTLKPCPFCRGEARWVEDHGRFDEPFGLVVEHAEDCFLGNRMMAEWKHIIAAWNNRAAQSDLLAALREARGLAHAGNGAWRKIMEHGFIPDAASISAVQGFLDRSEALIATIDAALAQHGEG